MESTANKKAKVFRSKQEIERLLQDWKKSGQSVKAFCTSLQISDGTFYHWKEKYLKSRTSPKAGFAPVEIVSSGGNSLFAEVGSIKIYQPVSAAYLKELLT